MTLTQTLQAPNKCITTQSRHKSLSVASDIDQHADNLSHWQQRYNQLSAGSFYGSITELQLEGLQVFKEHTSQALQQRCNVWSDAIWLGLAENANLPVRINGLTVQAEHMMCSPGDREFELLTPSNFDIYGLVISKEKLFNHAQAQGINIDWDLLTSSRRLHLSKNKLQAIRYLVSRILDNKTAYISPKLSNDLLMIALIEVVENTRKTEKVTASFNRRRAVVEQVKDYLRQYKEEPISILDLCEACHVSRRTLQYSFETVMGVSPLQYLRLSRLNGVRRDLSNTTDNRSIADIAAEWGFWHMSQFSQDYKHLFNEQPSQTLHRRHIDARYLTAQA